MTGRAPDGLDAIAVPALTWLERRAACRGGAAGWGWVVNDPVVWHLAPVLHLLGRGGRVELADEARQGCSDRYWGNKARWLTKEHALGKLLPALAAAGVEVIPLKGAAFIGRLYPNSGLRSMSDIDLLVRPEAFQAAIQVLLDQGFLVHEKDRFENLTWFLDIPRRYWPKELAFYTPQGVMIELHQALTASWYQTAFPVDLDALWQRSQIVEAGRSRGSPLLFTRHLSPEDTLAHLVLHQAMHGLKFQPAYLDIDLILRNLPAGWDWGRFTARVGAWRIRSAAYHVLSFCQVFMDTPLPEDLLTHLDPGRLARWRVGQLITAQDLLAGRRTPGIRFPTLVKLALIDQVTTLGRTLLRIAFPERAYYRHHPRRRSLLSNWRHLLKAFKVGN